MLYAVAATGKPEAETMNCSEVFICRGFQNEETKNLKAYILIKYH
jgi:hypothetical protein